MTSIQVLGNYTTPQVVLAGTKPVTTITQELKRSPCDVWFLSSLLLFWNAVRDTWWWERGMVLSKLTGGMIMGMTSMSKSSKGSNVFWAVSILITCSSINWCHCSLCVFHCELCSRIDHRKRKWFYFFTGKRKFRQDWKSSFISSKHLWS